MKESKLTPRITETAKGLWVVYGGITTVCILAFRIGGMSWLDAVIHAFSVMGLGGFSSHDASFGYFNSVTLEIIAEVFALIAGLNFATHFLAWRQRRFRPYQHDPEVGAFFAVVFGSCLLVAAYLYWSNVYIDFPTALRHATFGVISISTTLGLVTEDFNQWPIFAGLWLLFLCSFTTCAGSTGGGIKMMRAILLYKQAYREFKLLIHPQAECPTKLAGHVIPFKIVHAILAFGFIYIASTVSLTLVLAVSGLDIITAFTAVVATINNTGPGLARVGPATNYASLNDFQTWVCTFSMLLGRLEIFSLLIVFSPVFWKK